MKPQTHLSMHPLPLPTGEEPPHPHPLPEGMSRGPRDQLNEVGCPGAAPISLLTLPTSSEGSCSCPSPVGRKLVTEVTQA